MTDLVCSYYTLAGVSPVAGGASPLRFEDRVSAAARAGYSGIGMHVRDYRAMLEQGYDDARIGGILRDHDIRHVEVEFLLNWFADGPAGAASRADELVLYHMSETFGANVMFLSADLTADSQMSQEELAERLSALCGRAAERGVRIGLEPCAWTAVGTVDEARRLIADSGARNAGLFLDLWHLFRRGYDYSRIARIDPSTIYGVQLDDALREQVGAPIEDCLDRRLLPGEGDADAPAFVAALQAAGITCPISVEVISDEQRARSLDEMALASARAARDVIERASRIERIQ